MSAEAVEIQRVAYEVVEPLAPQAAIEDCHVWGNGLYWWAAFVDGELAGSAALLPIGKEARLRGWYVLPQYRGKGIGRALCETVEQAARDGGFDHIEAKTRYTAELARWGWTDTGAVYTSWMKPCAECRKRIPKGVKPPLLRLGGKFTKAFG
jgi:GNAT superfamily N-acetyltransferase